MKIHITRRIADEYENLWCPYCDEIVKFGMQYYYDEIWCTKCGLDFPPHQWPKGFDIKTGELSNEME